MTKSLQDSWNYGTKPLTGNTPVKSDQWSDPKLVYVQNSVKSKRKIIGKQNDINRMWSGINRSLDVESIREAPRSILSPLINLDERTNFYKRLAEGYKNALDK